MAVFRTGPFFGVDLALNMTSVLPVCFYGTFETEPFFWEGGERMRCTHLLLLVHSFGGNWWP